MAVSPVTSDQEYLSISIFLNGKPIDEIHQIVSVNTTKTINEIPSASIVLAGNGNASGILELSNISDFLPGTEIEIKAGYEDENETIFKGILIKYGVSVALRATTIKLECQDKAVRMTAVRNNAYYTNKKDSEIISNLLFDTDVSAEVEVTSYQHKNMMQYNVSDWDFMLTRADANGLLVMVNDGKVSVKIPDTSLTAILVVKYGETIINFNAEIDDMDQVKSIIGYAWDSATQKIVTVTEQLDLKTSGNIQKGQLADVKDLNENNVLSNGGVDVDEMMIWTMAKKARTKLGSIKGSVTFQGSALALPGDMLQLEGVGGRFDGNVFISSVNQVIEGGVWTTAVMFGMSPQLHIEKERNVVSPLASGLLPGINGLQIGVVMQIDNDPDGNYRVLTKIPAMLQDQDAVWARLGTGFASNGYGCFFYPEVNDEVILGFVNDDPRNAVILGSVYSKKNEPPIIPENGNEKKAIITKSKLEVLFDETDKEILIKTPEGNQVSISDKNRGIVLTDQNMNSVILDRSGITLDSATNIHIKAKGDITMEAGGNLAQTARANVTVDGLQIENTAKTSFTAKGETSTEVSSSGQTTVKGSIVLIN